MLRWTLYTISLTYVSGYVAGCLVACRHTEEYVLVDNGLLGEAPKVVWPDGIGSL